MHCSKHIDFSSHVLVRNFDCLLQWLATGSLRFSGIEIENATFTFLWR